jgi:hypothetical protein
MSATKPQIASAARNVLKRAEYMSTELRADPRGDAWEAKFSASIALLRSVGHVLDKTDGKRSAKLRAAIDQWWTPINAGKRQKAPEIFWAFIDEERNLILKEGDVRAGQSTMIELVGVSATALVAGQTPPPPPPPPKPPKATHSYHMNHGPFAGRDPRDLIEEAIAWWRTQLDLIEEKANA